MLVNQETLWNTMGIYVDVIISVVSRDGSELDKQK